MDKLSKNRWQIRAAVLIIFLLGFAAGALAPRAYYAWQRFAGTDSRQDRFAQMVDRLQLNAAQKTQVQQIFGDTREQLVALRRESDSRVAEIRRQGDERLRQVLTPEQWQRFQQMKDEMRGRGRRGRGNRGNAPPEH